MRIREYFYGIITDQRKGVDTYLVKFFLFIFSLIYGLGVAIIKLLYKLKILKVTKLNCKVISIGNITWGGTGKTPLVELVASRLKAQGHKVVILTRGYKSDDEPNLLKQRLPDIPVIVGRDRVKTGRLAIEKYNADTIILDDGFQHWRLFRDLDIVAINAANPFGNKSLIPCGILREPMAALHRADIIVLTKTFLKPDIVALENQIRKIRQDFLIVDSVYEVDNLPCLGVRPVAALSAIADPESFERMLASLGMNVALRLRFPDHHNYRQGDIEGIRRECSQKNIQAIITTEKDAVKLKDKLDYLVLKIKAKIIQDETFFKRVSSIY